MTMEERKAFGRNLRALRLRQAMSQERLAEKLEVSSTAVKYWEAAVHEPRTSHIGRICRFFSVRYERMIK